MALWTLPVHPIVLAAAVFLLWVSGGAIYRLYFSPLAKFPGRKLAIVTLWYEFYYNAIKGGRYVWEIEKMHQEYGPIVRINPYELHINDPDYYDQLYNSKKYDKYGWHVQQFGHPASSANTVHHHLHKMRRGVISPYFSRGMILRLEQGVIRKTVDKLCERIEEFRASKQPLPLGTAYRAFTTDVVTEYTMAKSLNFLDRPDFNERWFNEFLENVKLVHFVTQFPWFPKFAKSLPVWLRGMLLPKTAQLLEFHHVIEDIVVQTKNTPDDDYNSKASPTVFYDMFNADVPAEEKTIDRLTEEGILFVVAGNETTGNALSIMAFHLLDNPTILQTLKKELIDAMPDPKIPATWQELEKLPYLSAVITEGLRMSFGVVSRMPRIAPNTTLFYKDWVIPPNTPVGMNNFYMHNNPDIFTNPLTFSPERWLQPNSKDLLKYFVPFSRGTRMCTGINLAYAELYVTLAAVFRRFDMELFETTKADVDVAHEYHIPQVRQSSKGVRVMVK
ncbi:MAG: hypothetical protein M1830_008971 [Pleopsidium flavum]|nr:MAG: hypothetical protein M1830_008971 [Pleopsidium flavum]